MWKKHQDVDLQGLQWLELSDKVYKLNVYGTCKEEMEYKLRKQ